MLNKSKTIKFPESFYITKDKKSILGECTFSDILFLEYRDSEAGSNPREYQGLKKTNIEILDSLLVHANTIFRFLHSGIIVSITDLKILDDLTISYRSSCLTNGNQTRFIILILILIKKIYKQNKLEKLNKDDVQLYLDKNYPNHLSERQFINLVRLEHFNQVINYILESKSRIDSFNKLLEKEFLSSRIRITLNVIDHIIENIEDLDENEAGTQIATANNDTQNVKVDDIFGTTYKRLLKDEIFKDFINSKKNIEIEYSFGESSEKEKKVHILELLRPTVYIGILTQDIDVYKYSNQRIPIYNLIKKLLNKRNKTKETIKIISKLVPFLYDINEKYVKNNIRAKKVNKIMNLKGDAIEGKLKNTSIRDKIRIENGDLADESVNAIKRIANYNLNHIYPVIVYTIRKYIECDERTGELNLTMNVKDLDKFFETIVEACYNEYINIKLTGVTTSLSDSVRGQSFFESGEKAIHYIKSFINIKESSFIFDHKSIINEDQSRKKNKK